MGDKYIFTTTVLIFLNQVVCLSGTELCKEKDGTGYVCEAGFHCCEDDTKCCPDGMSALEVVGIVFCVFLGVSICIIVLLCVTKKKNHHNQTIRPFHDDDDYSISMISRPQRYPYQNFNVTNLLLTRPSAQDWREWRCIDGPRTSTPLPVAFPAAPVQPPPYSRADPLQPALLTQPPPAYREAV